MTTDEYHYMAWKRLADEEGIPFDRRMNERFRGVSRMDCLKILLENANRTASPQEEIALATRKNGYYVESLTGLDENALLPFVKSTLIALKEDGYRIAVGSSSKNARLILRKCGISDLFDAIIDGNNIHNSKPDPEVFLLAAKAVMTDSRECAVVEDSVAGIDAALAGGMLAIGCGSAMDYEKTDIKMVDMSCLRACL